MQDNKYLNGYVAERDDIDDIELDGDGIADGGLDSREMQTARPKNFYPTCRYCGQTKLPLARVRKSRRSKRGGNPRVRLSRRTHLSSGHRTQGKARPKY